MRGGASRILNSAGFTNVGPYGGSAWRRQDLMRGAQNYMKLFVAHNMTWNNLIHWTKFV